MFNVEKLVVKFQADASQFNPVLSKVTGNITKVAKKMTSIGRSMTIGLTLPLMLMGGVAVRQFAAFDKAMTESTAIMQVGEDQMAAMTAEAKRLIKFGPQSATELAESYFFLASAGMNAEQSIGALSIVQSFATAGNFNMAKATDLLTDAQSALGLALGDTEDRMRQMVRLSDVLVKANTLANASVEQFSTALTSKAGASLKAFGKEVEEGVAVLAAYADQGVKAELAGNALDRVMRLLSASTRKNAEAHTLLGFKVFDSQGAMRNMADIIGNLEDILGDMSVETRSATLDMLGFDARVQQVILPLLGTSNAIREYERKLKSAAGTTQSVSEKQMVGFANSMKVVKNTVMVAAASLGEALGPALTYIGGIVESLADWFTQLEASTKGWIAAIGVVVAVAGPLLLIMGSMAAATTSLVVGMAALGVTAPVVALALGAIVAVGFGLWLYNANQDIIDFNRELERSVDLAELLSKRIDKQNAGILSSVQNKKGDGRGEFIQDEIDKAFKVIQGYRRGVSDAKDEVEKLNGVWNRYTGNKNLIMANQQLKEEEARLKSTQDLFDKLTGIQKAEGAGGVDKGAENKFEGASGDLPTTLKELEALFNGADEQARKAKQAETDLQAAMSRGIALRESMFTPQEQYNKTLDDMEHLLSIGAINQNDFNRAMEKADDVLNSDAIAKRNARMEEGLRITKQFETPLEKHAKRMMHLHDLHKEGVLDFVAYGRAKDAVNKTLADANEDGVNAIPEAADRDLNINLQEEQKQLLVAQALDPIGGKTEDPKTKYTRDTAETLARMEKRSKKGDITGGTGSLFIKEIGGG